MIGSPLLRRALLPGAAVSLLVACRDLPSAPDPTASPGLALSADDQLRDGLVRTLQSPSLNLAPDAGLSGPLADSRSTRATLYRWVSAPVRVSDRVDARFEWRLPIEMVFNIEGRGVVVQPRQIQRYVGRTATDFVSLADPIDVAVLLTRADGATNCGSRSLMLEGTLHLASGPLHGAVGALHLLPRGAPGLLGSDCPFLTVGWDGWLDVIPGLLCERQACAFTVGGILTKKRTLYTGKCTPVLTAPWLCACSPV